MKRLISTILILVLSLSVFASCSRDKSVVLFFAVDSRAGSFDPQIAKGSTTRLIVRNCFEGLVGIGEDGKIKPGVAEKWDVSDDGLTYTFYLRKNAVWHLTSNAQEQLEGRIPENFAPHVTAQDFVFAFRRAIDPANASADSYMFMNIEGADEIAKNKAAPDSLGVEAVNNTTLQIKLAEKQSNFLEILLSPAAMPCNETFFNACIGRYGTYIKFLLSNGPFYLSRFDETSYRINKSPDYAGVNTAKADAVWFYCVSDRKKLAEDTEDNEYSGAMFTENEFNDMNVSKSKTVISSGNTIRSLMFNMKDTYLSCPDLRRAFAAATNASLIADNAGRKHYGSFVPESVADSDIAAHPVMFNENNADTYLKKAFKELDVSNISLTVLCEKQYEELMRKMLQEWQRILGVSVALAVESVTRAELDTAVAKGNYQIVFYPVNGDAASAYEYFGTYTPNNATSPTGYSNASVTTLLSELCSGGKQKYREVYSEIENKFADVSFMIPVWTENTYYILTKDVSGVIYRSGSDSLYLYNATNKKG